MQFYELVICVVVTVNICFLFIFSFSGVNRDAVNIFRESEKLLNYTKQTVVGSDKNSLLCYLRIEINHFISVD